MTERTIVSERLRRLDDLEVPDLRDAIDERAVHTYVTVSRSERPRRSRVLIRAAAVLVVALVAFAIRHSVGNDPTRVDVRDDAPDAPATPGNWQVRGEIDLSLLSPNGSTLMAPTDRQVWVARSGGTVVDLIDGATGTPVLVRAIGLAGVVDLAADETASGTSTAFAVTQEGELVELSADGSTRVLRELGGAGASTRRVAVAAGKVWVSDAASPNLLAIDIATGEPSTITTDRALADVIGRDDQLWAVGTDGRSVSRIDTASSTAGASIDVGAIGAAAIGRDSLWLLDETDKALVRVSGEGPPEKITSLSSGTDSVSTTSDMVWTHDRFVVQGYDLDGALRSTLVPTAPKQYVQYSRGSIVGSAEQVWVASPDTGRLALIGRDR